MAYKMDMELYDALYFFITNNNMGQIVVFVFSVQLLNKKMAFG